MKTSLSLALATLLSLASCTSDPSPFPELTRSLAPADTMPSQSLSFDLGDTVMEEDVDSVVFHAAPWEGVDVGVDL